ncbi:MAG: hypothetical protein ABI806_08800 [Candidatus Solibacter sp.]
MCKLQGREDEIPKPDYCVGHVDVCNDGFRSKLFGNYTYMQFNPTINGLNSRALNGGGGGAQWNIKPMFGIKAELQGYRARRRR